MTFFLPTYNFTGKKLSFSKTNFERKNCRWFSTISLSVFVLCSTSLFPRRSLSREFLGSRVMFDDDDLDPEAAGRCPPYSDLIPSARFSAPHLSLLVLRTEDVSALFPGDLVVSSPPTTSPFHAWMVSGVPGTFVGPMIHSMVFHRHLSRRGLDDSRPLQAAVLCKGHLGGGAPFPDLHAARMVLLRV